MAPAAYVLRISRQVKKLGCYLVVSMLSTLFVLSSGMKQAFQLYNQLDNLKLNLKNTKIAQSVVVGTQNHVEIHPKAMILTKHWWT